MNKIVKIYTDGACKGNPGVGGWAAILYYQHHEKIISGYDMETTNNRMELVATIKGLEALKKHCTIELYTDSQYVKNGILIWMKNWKQNNWKNSSGKQVKNQDLWQQLDFQNKRHNIHWYWVKGHSGHKGNELADTIASMAAKNALKEKG